MVDRFYLSNRALRDHFASQAYREVQGTRMQWIEGGALLAGGCLFGASIAAYAALTGSPDKQPLAVAFASIAGASTSLALVMGWRWLISARRALKGQLDYDWAVRRRARLAAARALKS